MNHERFGDAWKKRRPGCSVKDELKKWEADEVNAFWATMPGDSTWEDAFHALWRIADSVGHAELFKGTFYATAETMHAEDERQECASCGSADLTLLGKLGARAHFRCRDCGQDQSVPS